LPRRKDFATQEAYRKWLAYGHIRGLFAKKKGHTEIYIGGKKRKVEHGKT